MAKSQVSEAVFTSGQNEGVERSILPLPQLAVVQNARQRKTGRWGKRYGLTTLSALTTSGSALGNGTNARRSIGPGFCSVDDRCYVYDRSSGTWSDPAQVSAKNVSTATITSNPRVPGAVSGWLPNPSYLPIPDLSPQGQFLTNCTQTYCLGYLWSCMAFIEPVTNKAMLRVAATNTTDQTLVFLQDIRTATGSAGLVTPRLIACGTTVVLVYVDVVAHACARNLTSLAVGFSAETIIGTINATFIYDATPLDSTQFLLARHSTTATDVIVDQMNATSLASVHGATYADALPTITTVSVVAASGGPIYLTTGAHNGAGPVDATRVTVYAVNFGSLVGTVTVDATTSGSAASVVLPGGGVRCMYGSAALTVTGAVLQSFCWVDVTASATIATALRLKQRGYQPISRPFVVGTEVYAWVSNQDVLTIAGGVGYATMLRLPALSEFSGTFPTANTYPEVSCPIEMSPQDFVVAGLISFLGDYWSGVPTPIQIGTSATWAFMTPTYSTLPGGGATNLYEFRSVAATHYTDSAGNRSVNSFVADGSSYLPGAALTRIDGRGASEVGYVRTPVLFGAVLAAGGALTASSTYKYVAVYRSRNGGNRSELSAPSPVLSVTLGVGQTQATLSIKALDSTARASVTVDVYRTLSNGSVFYLDNSMDGMADPGNSGVRSYTSTAADATISSGQILYTQVGQTLPNCFPPPCHFGVYGAQRIHLGGLLRGDVSHCSKLILGDQSPSWADNDAFRIVWPSTLTGLAFMDNLIGFTDEGVYVVSGDGPDDSGDGTFSPPQRLPYADGCIEPRSIFSCDEGTFYQTRRGLYMMPRGFGAPVPAGDVVMDTLKSCPIITGVAVVNKPGEQTIRWTCVDSPGALSGRVIVYDLAHKCWSVDTVGNTLTPYIAQGQWFSGEVAMAGPTVGGSSQVTTSSLYSDEGSVISMVLQTGDLRPFGSMSEGVISKIDTLAEVRSACTLQVTKLTEFGTSPASSRVFALAAGDYQPGQISVTETELGNAELRDVGSLRINWQESSTSEGLAFVALAVEHEQGEGLKRVSPLSRTT